MKLGVTALFVAALSSVHAAPFTPRSDADVIEQLPLRTDRGRQRAEQRLLATRPRELALALPAAREAIERSRRYGDPRELGTAEAWLRPWWNDEAAAPPPVLLLKATILQARHDFDASLAVLGRLLARTALPPALQAQAMLTRAGVLQVRGRWAEVRADCERLAAPPLSLPHGAACLAELDDLQGGEAAVLQQRLAALDRLSNAPHGWIALLRAEGAERRRAPQAGPLYAQALERDGDLYSRAAYADWLLDAGRPADAAAIVRAGQPPGLDALPDNLLLRLAIALRRSRDPGAAAAADEMQQRFDAAALRGDASHGRERARFALDVREDPREALSQASSNWQQQCEPADALLLARAARVAGQPGAAEPLRAFVREQGLRDGRLEALLK